MFTNILILYIIGTLLSFGMTYTLNSYKCLNKEATLDFYITSALLSWFIVGAFFIGVLKGVVEVFRETD